MKALLTGSSGFCGKALSAHLASQGVEVFPFGRSTGADFEDVPALTARIGELKPDYVFHLGGVAVGTDISQYYRVNTLYAANLLRALELAGFAEVPVLLVGTSAEYGWVREEDLPVSEKTPANPCSLYGASKLAQTQLGKLAADRLKRPVVIARPFNIIGRGMPAHLALQAFATQVRAVGPGRPGFIEVGNLSASRDFVDVEDVAEIFWRLMRTPSSYGSVYNVCSGKPVIMRSLLERLIGISEKKIEIRINPTLIKPVDVPAVFGNNERLHQAIGAVQYTDLDTTLERVLS